MRPRLLLIGALLSLAPSDAIRVSVASRALQPGELVVLTITTAQPAPALRIRAFDRDIPAFRVAPGTWRALVGIDLDVAPGPHAVSVSVPGSDPPAEATHSLLVRARHFATRSLNVDEAFVNPPPAVEARIQEEASELGRIWKSSTTERLWNAAFVRPVPGQANSAFGTRSVFNGQPRSPHGGADLLSPSGTPIHAPNAGRVVLARDLYYTGNTVIIDHGLGLLSMLAHLSEIDVHEGDVVSAGQVVGLVGATGRVTGPHLHWAMRVGGARVDPLSVLALLGRDKLGDF